MSQCSEGQQPFQLRYGAADGPLTATGDDKL